MPLATFQDLTTWTPTIHTLHQAAQVIARVQATVLPARRNALHLGLEPTPAGLRTQRLPGGMHVVLNFAGLTVMVEDAAAGEAIDLTAHTQASLLRTLQDRLTLAEVRKAETVSGIERLDRADRAVARAYAEAQYAAFTGIARFRARLEGHLSPVVVWAHHLDISTLVFSPANAAMNEAKAHLNFGFAPFTEGQYARPYLYAYAYPYPDGFIPPALPAPLVWNREGWTGIVTGIDALAQADDPAAMIEALCEQMGAVLMPLLE
ncbi:MAG: DUF5996 family protein [Anaerolineae bacterium]|nr:DUF5996 family protein [Anaerolineae bacterium]NUQ04373.1 hypothetical protein [Anaerolineae bacterium]